VFVYGNILKRKVNDYHCMLDLVDLHYYRAAF